MSVRDGPDRKGLGRKGPAAVAGLLALLISTGLPASQLHQAVSAGDIDRVRALITPAQDIDEMDTSGMAAIHLAVLEHQLELIEFLIHNGADVNIAVNSNEAERRFFTPLHNFSPLHIATNLNSLEMASLLISRGADVNQTTDDGQSPLHIAAMKGNDRLAELLIGHGAHVNARDFEDYTPLHSAARYGRLGSVELLLSNGADITARGSDGQTAYACAVGRNHQQIVSFLENLGIVE